MNSIQLDALQIRHAAAQISDTAAPLPAAGMTAGAPAGNFSHAMADAIREVDASQRTAETSMAAVDNGRSDDLVGAMLASRRASLSFSMLTQVRNKVTSALDELLKLQL